MTYERGCSSLLEISFTANCLTVRRSQATVAELYDSAVLQHHHFNYFAILLEIEASVYDI